MCLFFNFVSSSQPRVSLLALAGGRCRPAWGGGFSAPSPEPPPTFLMGLPGGCWGFLDQPPLLVTGQPWACLFQPRASLFQPRLLLFNWVLSAFKRLLFNHFCDLGSLCGSPLQPLVSLFPLQKVEKETDKVEKRYRQKKRQARLNKRQPRTTVGKKRSKVEKTQVEKMIPPFQTCLSFQHTRWLRVCCHRCRQLSALCVDWVWGG